MTASNIRSLSERSAVTNSSGKVKAETNDGECTRAAGSSAHKSALSQVYSGSV